MAINPPVLVPPIKSKFSHGLGVVSAPETMDFRIVLQVILKKARIVYLLSPANPNTADNAAEYQSPESCDWNHYAECRKYY